MTPLPVLAGAVQETWAWLLPGVATTPVGGPGSGMGLVTVVVAPADPGPTALVATTVKT
jgi:hypothetical protein